MSYILDQDEMYIIYYDDAFECNEEDPSTYCLAVTTRNGKVLQQEPGISTEEETHIEEELSLNIGLAPWKVINETSIEEMNEELKVEASIPLPKLPIPLPLFPQQVKKKCDDERMAKYLDMLKQVSLDI
ncbi:hypothetical protein HAX54_050080 [Datura stramonium]|uniref:Uncharacterized protein n=1 Tax=Datura stramonium TaxID=4076 RepID=A0ABS8SXI8_DATST|nr:hypothetical protein [Datura stramonium]